MDIRSFRFLCAVETFLLSPDKKEVLLMHRSRERDFLPDYYAGIGGKMDSKEHENPLEAALREMKEESNYSSHEIRDLRLKAVITVFDRWGKWIVFEFTGQVKRKKYKRREVKKEGTLEWVSLDRLKNLKLIQDLRKGTLEKILFTKRFLWLKSIFNKKDRLVRFEIQ
ncbi:MAG: NUDIX domain-containing protein [bacterium]|nr:NUDIX domain-containing protein [bacterium]